VHEAEPQVVSIEMAGQYNPSVGRPPENCDFYEGEIDHEICAVVFCAVAAVGQWQQNVCGGRR
jgi:hypothetical protein